MIELGVNIDHVATLRNARGTVYPDPIKAALLAEQAGADLITLHLREDRRHIKDADVAAIRPLLATRMNLESAVSDEMIAIALRVQPQDVCLVPERRAEVTTEGGLDVVGGFERVAAATARLHDAGIRVSLFIDPDWAQLDAAARAGARIVELHTGAYADADEGVQALELARIRAAVAHGVALGLRVNAGHGLNYENLPLIHRVPHLVELNIGHSIICRAITTGLATAVQNMLGLIKNYRG